MVITVVGNVKGSKPEEVTW